MINDLRSITAGDRVWMYCFYGTDRMGVVTKVTRQSIYIGQSAYDRSTGVEKHVKCGSPNSLRTLAYHQDCQLAIRAAKVLREAGVELRDNKPEFALPIYCALQDTLSLEVL